MSKIAIFAGSFDPFTNGHLYTVEQGAKLFDKLIVCVATNPHKQTLFSPEERVSLIEKATTLLTNVSVIHRAADLTVNVAAEYQASYLLRGIRNEQDYEYERDIAAVNAQLAPEITTIFINAPADLTTISSSTVKELAQFKAKLTRFVPPIVETALKNKLLK